MSEDDSYNKSGNDDDDDDNDEMEVDGYDG
jgi:hypothetical protein